jgi:hypothetical protein
MKVFTFTLYGTNPKYVRGLHENIKIISEKFPDFKVAVFCGNDAPVHEFANYPHVVLGPAKYPDHLARLDRFCAIDDKNVEIMIVRDSDSRINERDEWCIREFIKSPHMAHIIRDHPYHTTQIMAGLWGIKQGCIRHLDMRRYIDLYIQQNRHIRRQDCDQHFLRDIIYPKIVDMSLIHGCVKMNAHEEIVSIPFKHDHIFCGQAIEYTNEGAEYHNCNDCKALI